uniref:Protein FAM116B n=1 Tax=Aceria tosichella TaxID=561515 RepID=A0A6G1SIZ2_9ACAR
MDDPIDKKLYKIPEIPAHLSAWIHSIYIVTFDIEFGQAIEKQYPLDSKGLELTDQEANNICYSSFPDSNSSILGSTQFHFRMRLSNLDERLKLFYKQYNTKTTQALSVDTKFIYGYVHFLQRKDPTLKRGYFQKSLVILSMLPFVELFYNIVNIVGTRYFEVSNLQLKDIYDQILNWPQIETGSPLSLCMLNSNIALYIPNKDDKLNSLHANLSPASASYASRLRVIRNKQKPYSSNNNDVRDDFNSQLSSTGYLATTVHGTPLTLVKPHQNYQTILTAFDLDLYRCFYSVISDLQLLWEMILTCEPFIVIAHTPDVCANFVQALTSLIYPFKYNADFRPFFTIHDQEFKEYVGLKDSKPNVILGVTNPFFAKSLEHWPNVIQLCSMTSSKSSDQISSLITSLSSMNSQQPASVAMPQQALKIPFVDRLRFSSTEVHKPGLNTKYRAHLTKDRHFLTKILRSNKAHGNNRPNSVQTALIRRWLIELTQSFFMPLERYLTQLMPLHSKISPFKAPPELPSFDIEAFLATLDTSGPQLTTKIKGDWLGLYKKFFSCSNFYSWYSERKSEIDRKLWNLHLDTFLDIDLPQVIKSKDEVELVDMVIYFKRRLALAVSKSHDYHFSCENMEQFRYKLTELINALPEDMRTFFLQRQQ